MKLLLYCTKAKPYLYHDEDYCFDTMNTIDLGYKTFEYTNQRVYDDETGKFLGWETFGNMYKDYSLNGKIVAECDFEVDKLTNCGTSFRIMKYDDLQENYRYTNKVARGSCLDYTDLRRYLGTNNGYAIHIKNLHIFDKPRELKNYNYLRTSFFGTLGNAPQNMMYAYDNVEKKILISIHPEWLCKILNGEKTIEVRKKVLKEMLK